MIRVDHLVTQLLVKPGVYNRGVTDNLGLSQEPFRRAVRVDSLAAQVLIQWINYDIGEPVNDDLGLTDDVMVLQEFFDGQRVEQHLNLTDNRQRG